MILIDNSPSFTEGSELGLGLGSWLLKFDLVVVVLLLLRRIPEYSNNSDSGALMMLEGEIVPNLLEFEDDNDEDDEETKEEDEDEDEGDGPVPPPPPPAEGTLNMSVFDSMRGFPPISLTLTRNHQQKPPRNKKKKSF